MKVSKNGKNTNVANFFKNPLNIIGIILCIVLVPILIMNLILIVKSFADPDSVPSINGYSPLIVLTESMDPDIKAGDLIITKSIDKSEIEVGMTVSFFDPNSDSGAVVTHQIIEKIIEEGQVLYRTKGINNNISDRELVPEDNVIGEYTGTRFAGLGSIVLFAQSTWGLVICILIIVILFGIFILSSYLGNKKRSAESTDNSLAEAQAEIQALKEQLAEMNKDKKE